MEATIRLPPTPLSREAIGAPLVPSGRDYSSTLVKEAAMEHHGPNLLSIARTKGGVIVTMHGDLEADRTPLLGRFLSDLIDGQGNLDIVIDLRDVATIDGKSIDLLAAASQHTRARGGRLVLSTPFPEIRDDLRHAGLRIIHQAGSRRPSDVRPPPAVGD